MSSHTGSKGKYWMMTLISLVFTILLLIVVTPWFWVGLPFLGTSFVYAMDWV